MATLDFGAITAPAAAPYDAANPHQQRETLCYMLNQLLGQLAAQGATLNVDLTQAVQDLSYAGAKLELPGLTISRTGKDVTISYIP